jgi:NTE family protein
MGKKLGLCLTGGGARGGYQIGAIKAIEDLGLLDNVEAYSGTSIGAANAAVVASRGVDAAYDIWLSLPKDNMPRKGKDKEQEKGFNLQLDNGLYSMEIFEDVMVSAVDYEALRKKEVYATISEGGSADKGILELLKLSLDYYIKKEPHAQYLPLHKLSDKRIHKGIVASCSIPIFFSPVTMDGKKFYDGGVFDNTPVKPLVENGCDEIIVIHLHKNRSQVRKEDYPNVTFHEIRHSKARELGRILKFSKKQTKQLYQYGYEDAKNYFSSLK